MPYHPSRRGSLDPSRFVVVRVFIWFHAIIISSTLRLCQNLTAFRYVKTISLKASDPIAHQE